MFTWDVEEMALLNEKKGTHIGREKIYACESVLSREEKIAFVDEMQDGKLSYLLQLSEKLMSEKDSMPHDSWGDIKTVSLKAWIKRNDTRNMIDDWFRYGQVCLFVERYIQHIDAKGSWDTHKDFVDEVFHRQLKECESMEKKYFLEHDEYSVLKTAISEKSHRFGTTFGVHLSFGSDNSVSVCNDDGERRAITMEEAKLLLDKFRQLEELEEKLTEETHIVF